MNNCANADRNISFSPLKSREITEEQKQEKGSTTNTLESGMCVYIYYINRMDRIKATQGSSRKASPAQSGRFQP